MDTEYNPILAHCETKKLRNMLANVRAEYNAAKPGTLAHTWTELAIDNIRAELQGRAARLHAYTRRADDPQMQLPLE